MLNVTAFLFLYKNGKPIFLKNSVSGNMAAFDMSDPNSVVSPGGVGFDINCGVRLLRTNLTEKDVQPIKEQLAQCLFDHIPVGVGSKGIIPMNAKYEQFLFITE